MPGLRSDPAVMHSAHTFTKRMISATTSEKIAMDSEKIMPSIMLVRIRLPASGLRPIASTPSPHASPTPMPVPIAPTPIAKPAANWMFILVLLWLRRRRDAVPPLMVPRTQGRQSPPLPKRLTLGRGQRQAHNRAQDAEILLERSAPLRTERDPRARPLALERLVDGHVSQ